MSLTGSVRALIGLGRAVHARRLTMADCRLLAAAYGVQVAASLAISSVPVPAARRMLARVRRAAVALAGSAAEPRVAWAIQASERWRVGGSCLARALAAEVLLPVDCTLTTIIGVHREGGRLESHAWVERQGHVLVGGHAPEREYVPIATWRCSEV
jgi:hypothetical protein